MTPTPPTRTSRARRLRSVRVRILGAILVVSALGLVVSGGTSFLLQRDRILASVDEELRQQVESVRTIVESSAATSSEVQEGAPLTAAPTDGSGFNDIDALLRTVLGQALPRLDGSTVGLVDGVARWEPQPFALSFLLDDDDEFLARVSGETAGGATVLGSAETPDGSLRYAAVPVRVDGDTASGVFVTAIDVDARLSDLADVSRSYAAIAVVALAAIGLVGWFVAGRLLSPIRELRRTASRITATDLGERIPVAGDDDVSDLTRTVNDMIGRLEGSFESQRRLLADVRHELGTPITIVRGHLELVDPRDPHDIESTRTIALDELDRMSHLIDDIAELSEAERADQFSPQPTSIAELTHRVLAKVSVIPGHRWRAGPVADVELGVDARRITQAWLQLADNAAKYSPDGSVVVVGSERRGGRVELFVSDEGPGIPAAARERIFERFGRVDDGRGIRGSGLGLAIVSAIARAHDGSVELDSVPGRGTRFALSLPLAPDPARTPRTADDRKDLPE